MPQRTAADIPHRVPEPLGTESLVDRAEPSAKLPSVLVGQPNLPTRASVNEREEDERVRIARVERVTFHGLQRRQDVFDAGSGESEIRRYIFENDLLEALIALPEQLFYNTGIATYVWVVSNRKMLTRRGKVQLIDATSFWVQMRRSLGERQALARLCAGGPT